MSGGFSADWLALRAPADDRARAADLITAAASAVEGAAPLTIVDLGAGTGATMRALAPEFPTPQAWTLVDADPALLAVAEASAAGTQPGVVVTTRLADLVAEPAPWTESPSLVTASALFDLASRVWIDRLAAACAADRVPLLAMLTYDGVLQAAPVMPFDDTMRVAFNTHQRGEKSFGRAEGPDAPAALAAAFGAHGYRVMERETPWVLLAGRDDALIEAMLDGWAGAASEILPELTAEIARWRAARKRATERLTVGHKDQLFLPPSR